MHEFYLILGIVLLVVIGYDFFYTTLSFNGAGVLSQLMSRFLSAFFLILNRYIPERKALRYSGVTHVLFLIGLWIGFLWIGFFLLLMSDPDSVVEAGTGLAASALTKLYVSGYTLSTLGVGDYIPNSEGWQIVLAVFSFTGFIFITTAMTYLMSLTSAVLHKRSLSLFISNLGETPEEIILNTYSNKGFLPLEKRIPTLQNMINKHNQNHFAHPVVHHFYSSSSEESLSVNLARLDEALTILQYYVKHETSLDQDIRFLQDAIAKFLNTASRHFNGSSEGQSTHVADLQLLDDKGIPLLDKAGNSTAQELVARRRAMFGGLLKSSGWRWNNIYSTQPK